MLGAILGVMLTLGTLFGVVGAVDQRYVTRAEYGATLVDINHQLDAIRKATVAPAPQRP